MFYLTERDLDKVNASGHLETSNRRAQFRARNSLLLNLLVRQSLHVTVSGEKQTTRAQLSKALESKSTESSPMSIPFAAHRPARGQCRIRLL